MKEVKFTQEELEIMRTIMGYISDKSFYDFERNKNFEIESNIIKCEVLFNEEEIDLNLFKKIYNKLF
ncbi:MAG: hypothetical protein LBJ32_03990 [Oscillospiraceae bacterium]|jgi:hypothetical protein|nr:hypothetical protein [Oscillospiraceae bacterium]